MTDDEFKEKLAYVYDKFKEQELLEMKPICITVEPEISESLQVILDKVVGEHRIDAEKPKTILEIAEESIAEHKKAMLERSEWMKETEEEHVFWEDVYKNLLEIAKNDK